jgi:tetratricopeptide (TPR) repeat protein
MCWNRLKKAGRFLAVLGQPLRWILASLLCAGLWWGGGQVAIAGSFDQGLTALRAGDYNAAAVYLDQAIAQGDHRAAAYQQRCGVAVQMDDAEGAIAPCTAALTANPNAVDPYLYRGLAHYRLGQYGSAHADLTQYLRHRPDDGLAYYNRGLVAFAQASYDQAIADYHRALDYQAQLSSPALAQVYNDLGLAHWAQAQPAVAHAYLDHAIALDGNNLRAYYNRGCVCHHQRQYVAALADFEQVLALNPTHAETYLNRGMVRRQLGDRDGAISDWQRAADYFQTQGQMTGYHQARQLLRQSQSTAVALG